MVIERLPIKDDKDEYLEIKNIKIQVIPKTNP